RYGTSPNSLWLTTRSNHLGNRHSLTVFCGSLRRPRDHSQNDQQDNRADESVDDSGNNAAANYDADLRQQPASDQAADNANDDVADQPVTAALDHHTGQPTSDVTISQMM